MKSTQASEVTPCLDRVFSIHGIPREIKTKNRLPFTSAEFANYIEVLGIKYQPGTQLWPQSNAQMERFNQPLKKHYKQLD